MNEKNFYLKVAYALTDCQLVEQALKLYITEALDLVTKCVNDKISFKMSGEDYADASLERLIDVFKKLSDNHNLVIELRKFKEERNFLSHKGIANCLDQEDGLLHTSALEFQPRLDAIQSDARRLREMLHEEANKFRGHLLFGEISE